MFRKKLGYRVASLHKMKITLIKLSRDKPMAVGGMGMLSTSNYAARKFGVRAAMPGTNK